MFAPDQIIISFKTRDARDHNNLDVIKDPADVVLKVKLRKNKEKVVLIKSLVRSCKFL